MTRRIGLSLVVAAVAASTLSLAQSPASRGPSEQSFREKYAVLTERNIFSRARTSPSRRREEPRPVERPPEPEDLVVLTGTVQQGAARCAFVEERGRTTKIREGEGIAGGKVVKIGFNVLEFEKDGKKVVVEVGKSFSGKAPASRSRDGDRREPSSSSRTPASSSADGAAPGAAAASPGGQEPAKEEAKPTSGGGASDILERMRRRRLEEEQKK